MKYLSVCSGIEAASVAWEPLGWSPAGFSEIEAFPSAVLAHRFPGVKNYGDFTSITRSPELLSELGQVDLLVGGTPCQSFSVAGLRGGLGDARGNLALEFFRLAAALHPRWLVWENVPGVLSSGGGRDFGSILGALAELGYGYAYRVLDAQYVGACAVHREERGRGPVPQRRRRVFLVAHAGGRAERAAAVLFEPACVRGNPSEGEGARKEASSSARAGAASCGWSSNDGVTFAPATVGTLTDGAHAGGGLTARTHTRDVFCPSIANPLTARMGKGINTTADEGQTPIITGGVFDLSLPLPFDTTQVTRPTSHSNPQPGAASHTLAAQAHPPAIAFMWQVGATQQMSIDADKSPTLVKSQGPALSLPKIGVRRLMPVECERLQGFPDGWTDVPHRGKPAADAPRYKAIGNSMAVPVMRWIGRRIALVDRLVPWDGQESADQGLPKEVETKDGVQFAFDWA